jgi:hypothetical protein
MHKGNGINAKERPDTEKQNGIKRKRGDRKVFRTESQNAHSAW